jgi:hypothetical protein
MAAGMVRMFVILSRANDLLLLLPLLFLSAIPRRESVANRFFPPINAGAHISPRFLRRDVEYSTKLPSPSSQGESIFQASKPGAPSSPRFCFCG